MKEFKRNQKRIFILSSKDQQISNSIYLNTADRIKSLKMIENSRRFLDQLNKKNITQLIDVGASIGNVIITAISEKFYETGIAIEPSKEEFKILKANIILNNLENKIKLFNCALTNNESEFINFELDEKDIGDQRVFYKEYDGLWGERKRNIISVNNKTFARGGIGLYSSAEDYLSFSNMLHRLKYYSRSSYNWWIY